MGIRKRFNEIFGIEDNVEEERQRFVNRVNQSIFHDIDAEGAYEFGYPTLFGNICFELGVNAHDFRQREDRFRELIPPTIKTLTRDDFTETLRVLSILYSYVELGDSNEEGQKWLSQGVEFALSRCACDIGVRWKDGFFYPSGAEELDKPLIEETMTWLKEFPDEERNYRTALQCFITGEALTDVITNCYTAVEGVVRNVLGNNRTLDNNKDELLSKIDLSDGWKPILANYINYAHDYRHASTERHEIEPREAGAYLYMTGLIIRLIIESK